ncbi:hypothetical protein [Methylomarinum vadi]|uniref:hypothetical protein n=1 Tax=Methylomarinum vadi TaxID=438855 RepID=UPI0004DF42F6|nr:hypothetical protein [Methylomarinum vadi]
MKKKDNLIDLQQWKSANRQNGIDQPTKNPPIYGPTLFFLEKEEDNRDYELPEEHLYGMLIW